MTAGALKCLKQAIYLKHGTEEVQAVWLAVQGLIFIS
jgi:hypothetical protein